MGAVTAAHPTDQTLRAYGLGTLDDASAESVNKHLEFCPECRRRVAEMSSDSFLGRLQNAHEQPGKLPSDGAQSSDSLADRGPAVAIAPPPADTLPPGLAEHPDYEVIRELGRGGMGVVYLAYNRLMGREEVLKVVSGHLVERPSVRERFLREIQSAAKLHHKNIVTAYSAMRFGESIVLAMEYVEGYDLAELVKAEGPLPVAHACYFVHQAALGLQHAHERGMVHRDIKPANLILAREGKKAVIKVLDFGLAKMTSEGQADSALTGEGQMLGTPDYIAPEQIRNAQSADTRADIYSLGCTLFYLLAGRPPFRGDSLWDLYQAHFSMDAVPLNLFRPEVPVELAALVAKMLAKEADRRFQTPGEVAQALTPFFKKGSVAIVGSKAEMSKIREADEGQASTRMRSVPTQPKTNLEPIAAPSDKKSAGTARPETMWESLIELKEAQPLVESAPAVFMATRPPRWRWPSVAAGILLVGFIVACAVIIRVRTKNGAIVVKNVPEQGVASVDGEKVTLKLPGKRDPAVITVAPSGKGVTVKNGETVATGEEVNIGTGDGKGISAKFEPDVGAGPEENEIKESPTPAAQGEIRPFNDKNLRSRKVNVDYYARGLAGEWQPLRDNRGQVITGGAPALSSDGLELAFWKVHPEDQGGFDIYIARRDSVAEPFGQAIHQQFASAKKGQDYEPAFGGGDLALYMRVALTSHSLAGKTPQQIFRAVRKKRGLDFGVPKKLAEHPPVSLGGTRFSPDGQFSFYVPAGGSTYYRAEWNSKRRSFECAATNLPGLGADNSYEPRVIRVSNDGSLIFTWKINGTVWLATSRTVGGPMDYETPKQLMNLRLPNLKPAYVASLNQNSDVLITPQHQDEMILPVVDLTFMRLPEHIRQELSSVLGTRKKNPDVREADDGAEVDRTVEPSPTQQTAAGKTDAPAPLVDFYSRGKPGEWQLLRDVRESTMAGAGSDLSTDGLELAMRRTEPEGIYIARRSAIDQPFGEAKRQPLEGVSGMCHAPSFLHGDLQLSFINGTSGENTSPSTGMIAVRTVRGADFLRVPVRSEFPVTRWSPNARWAMSYSRTDQPSMLVERTLGAKPLVLRPTNLPARKNGVHSECIPIAIANDASVLFTQDIDGRIWLYGARRLAGTSSYEIPTRYLELKLPSGRTHRASLSRDARLMIDGHNDGLMYVMRLPDEPRRMIIQLLGSPFGDPLVSHTTAPTNSDVKATEPASTGKRARTAAKAQPKDRAP